MYKLYIYYYLLYIFKAVVSSFVKQYIQSLNSSSDGENIVVIRKYSSSMGVLRDYNTNDLVVAF